ncbi:MAG: hypothetical protein LH466_09350 [Sphingomonas bacterium]|nr:hypothetical protein [Sphingomonas bacterium]
MNGGLVPLMLLSATIGLMLAFVPGRRAWLALATFAIAAVPGFAIPLGLSPQIIFTALWLSAIVAAILVYVPVARWSMAVLPLCLNAGFWLGASAALTGNRSALVLGLLPILVAIPGRWLTHRKFDIVIKVVASWMIAIASLSLFVSLSPTPGYKPDHME